MGIDDRSNETVSALLSDKLFKNGGIVTRSGEKTYWDRATLYALRGMFYSGHQNEAVELLKAFTSARLLGEHIPYPVEAFPEGNQAQLSAESGLICVYSPRAFWVTDRQALTHFLSSRIFLTSGMKCRLKILCFAEKRRMLSF